MTPTSEKPPAAAPKVTVATNVSGAPARQRPRKTNWREVLKDNKRAVFAVVFLAICAYGSSFFYYRVEAPGGALAYPPGWRTTYEKQGVAVYHDLKFNGAVP